MRGRSGEAERNTGSLFSRNLLFIVLMVQFVLVVALLPIRQRSKKYYPIYTSCQ